MLRREDRQSLGVRCERCEQLEVVIIARDDLYVFVRGPRIGFGRDDSARHPMGRAAVPPRLRRVGASPAL